MAVLIKRMKMPKACNECVMREFDQYEGGRIYFCQATSSHKGSGAMIDDYTRRPKWCPLTEVSEVVSGTGLHTGIYKVDNKEMSEWFERMERAYKEANNEPESDNAK